MSKPFTIVVEFHNEVAYERRGELCSLVDAFNQQNNTQIDWFGNFYAELGVGYLQFQGSDAEKTTSCAQFVCETINKDSALPLTYTRAENTLDVTVH